MKSLFKYTPAGALFNQVSKALKKDENPPLNGYCSNCGKNCQHTFHESAATWKTMVAGALISSPILMLGSAFTDPVRDVYKCQSCDHLTLLCRAPKCTGMARTGSYYADQFCGQCLKMNDNSKLYEAFQAQKDNAKLKEIVKAQQQQIDEANARIEKLNRERSKDKELIKELIAFAKRKQQELDQLQQAMSRS